MGIVSDEELIAHIRESEEDSGTPLTENNVEQQKHDNVPKDAIDVAIGGKADMALCTAYVCF